MIDELLKQEIADDDPRYEILDKWLEERKGRAGIAMMAMQKAQSIFSYVPLEVHKHVSKKIGVSVAELYGITSFYSQFRTQKEGKHQISVCLGTACYVKGAQKVLDRLSKELNVSVNETTADGLFSLKAARCLGCCGLSPVMMIDDEVYANITDLEEIPSILAKYKDVITDKVEVLENPLIGDSDME